MAEPKLYQHKSSKSAREAEEFMRRNDNDMAARDNLLTTAEMKGFKSKEELEHYARKHGYLKTERDVRVFQDVVKKTKLKEDPAYMKKKLAEEKIKKQMMYEIAKSARKTSQEDIQDVIDQVTEQRYRSL